MLYLTKTLKLSIPALAAALMGCNLSDNLEGGGPAPEAALTLALKSSPECDSLHAQVMLGEGGGELHATFVATCVEEVKPGEDGILHTPPADHTPDPEIRCDWIAAGIEDGRAELADSYAYYCPEDCTALSLENPEAHVKYCVVPKEDPQPKDSHPVELVLE